MIRNIKKAGLFGYRKTLNRSIVNTRASEALQLAIAREITQRSQDTFSKVSALVL